MENAAATWGTASALAAGLQSPFLWALFWSPNLVFLLHAARGLQPAATEAVGWELKDAKLPFKLSSEAALRREHSYALWLPQPLVYIIALVVAPVPPTAKSVTV